MPMHEEGSGKSSWRSDVLRLIRRLWRPDQVFSLNDLYTHARALTSNHPDNQNVEAKIRQVLQQLRDQGEITFIDNAGHYSPQRCVHQPGDPLAHIRDIGLRAQLRRIREEIGQVVPSAELRHWIKGFGGQKGIYKPAGSPYALWIRETKKSPYADRDLDVRPDGSWIYRYSPEGRGGGPDLSLDTNRGLLKCQQDRVPVGVFRQVEEIDGKAAYEVLGLAYVQSFDGTHFILNGEPIDESHPPPFEMLTPEFHPFELDEASVSDVLRTVRDYRFGVALRRVYHERCGLCDMGFKVAGRPVALEAAHIIPVEKRGVLGDLRNGILLCRNHHALFDRYGWTLNEDLEVVLPEDSSFRASALGNHVLEMEGKRLPNLPSSIADYPAQKAIEWRLEQFERTWNR